jgi:hypothetical protein
VRARNGGTPDSVVSEIEGQKIVAGKRDGNSSKPKSRSARQSWRDVLPVHPAADLFDPLSEAELRELADDIKANGIKIPILIWRDKADDRTYLVDGRNRLDALDLNGVRLVNADGSIRWDDLDLPRNHAGKDPWSAAISANIHRRHLTNEKKREIIERLLKENPEQSNRTIAKETKSSHKKVAKIRAKLESTGALPQLEKTTGADGKARKQPAKRKPAEQNVFDSPQEAHGHSPLRSGEDSPQVDPSKQEQWQRSVSNMAGEVISLPANW